MTVLDRLRTWRLVFQIIKKAKYVKFHISSYFYAIYYWIFLLVNISELHVFTCISHKSLHLYIGVEIFKHAELSLS